MEDTNVASSGYSENNSIHYIYGDATDPIKKPAVIAHVVNSIGAWGRGFVLSLSARDRTPEMEYQKWFKTRKLSSGTPFQLGEIQIVPYTPEVLVANMIAQKGIKRNNSKPPIRYDALEKCLTKLYAFMAKNPEYTVHAPLFGAGLAGGNWNKIEGILQKTLQADTYIYRRRKV